MTYLGWWGQDVLPGRGEDDGLCGNCHSRPARAGDWLCSACRRELEAELQKNLEQEARDGND